jgi:hypothetical protein
LGVLVPTNTKLTHVFDSKVLVLVLVCYKLTLTPPSKHGLCLVWYQKSFRTATQSPKRNFSIKIFITKLYMCTLWKYFSRKIYLYDFHIFKHNNFKFIYDLYFQCWTQTLSEMTSNTKAGYLICSLSFLLGLHRHIP